MSEITVKIKYIWDDRVEDWIKIDTISDDLVITTENGDMQTLRFYVDLLENKPCYDIFKLSLVNNMSLFDDSDDIGSECHEDYLSLNTYDELVEYIRKVILTKDLIK